MRNQKGSINFVWKAMFTALLGLSTSGWLPAATMCSGPNWVSMCTAGLDTFNSDAIHIVVLFPSGVQLPTVDLSGPTTIQRGDPSGSPAVIPTQITSMSLMGTTPTGDALTLMAGNNVPNLPPSLGQITARPDGLTADSFFDVFFVLQGTALSSLGPLHNTTPVHMAAVIDKVPPLVPPGTCTSSMPPPFVMNCYYGMNVPVPLLNQAGVEVAVLTVAIHEPKIPEPRTGVLSTSALLIALVIGRRKLLRRTGAYAIREH
jgi:hypothetical protein